MSDYKTPKEKLIDSEKAAALNKTYREKRMAMINRGNGIQDSCSSWYSLEDLEGYLNYVKEEAKKKNISIDGIRFYFGVYPEDTEDSKMAGKTTLFMCPTKACTTLTRDGKGNSEDVTDIPGLNYGNEGNPPQINYGG